MIDRGKRVAATESDAGKMGGLNGNQSFPGSDDRRENRRGFRRISDSPSLPLSLCLLSFFFQREKRSTFE